MDERRLTRNQKLICLVLLAATTGLALIAWAVKREDVWLAYAASPLLAPYFISHLLIGPFLVLVTRSKRWAVVAAFSWRIPLTQERLAYPGIFLILTFAGLVMSQLGPRAHINHTYAGLVPLIPLAIANRRVLVSWVIMVTIHLYSHLAVYHLGRDMVLPEMYLDYTPAQLLIAQVKAALVTQAYNPLLQFQGSINQWLRRWRVEPVITQLSVIQFVCVMIIIYELFHIARPGLDTLLGKLPGDDEMAAGDAVHRGGKGESNGRHPIGLTVGLGQNSVQR